MPGRYASAGVEDLAAFLEANLATHIDAVEVDESVTLANPDVYRRAEHPAAVETLAIEVDCPGHESEDLINDVEALDLVVNVVLRSPDADVVAAKRNLRRYVTAIRRCLKADVTLGGKCFDTQPGRTEYAGIGDDGQLVLVASTAVLMKRHEN